MSIFELAVVVDGDDGCFSGRLNGVPPRILFFLSQGSLVETVGFIRYGSLRVAVVVIVVTHLLWSIELTANVALSMYCYSNWGFEVPFVSGSLRCFTQVFVLSRHAARPIASFSRVEINGLIFIMLCLAQDTFALNTKRKMRQIT